MKPDLWDVLFAAGAISAGVGLWLIHPKAFFGGLVVGGVLLMAGAIAIRLGK